MSAVLARSFGGAYLCGMSANPPLQHDGLGPPAPTLGDFERMAAIALESLPEAFRRQCAGVAIRIEDFPDAATLREMKCGSRYDLLGLFRGRGLAHRQATLQTGEFPNMVWLYRRPILRYWAGREDSLQDIVTHVLIHEIGHHFGLSDDEMYAIDGEE